MINKDKSNNNNEQFVFFLPETSVSLFSNYRKHLKLAKSGDSNYLFHSFI